LGSFAEYRRVKACLLTRFVPLNRNVPSIRRAVVARLPLVLGRHRRQTGIAYTKREGRDFGALDALAQDRGEPFLRDVFIPKWDVVCRHGRFGRGLLLFEGRNEPVLLFRVRPEWFAPFGALREPRSLMDETNQSAAVNASQPLPLTLTRDAPSQSVVI
jgi:hypothetical protein